MPLLHVLATLVVAPYAALAVGFVQCGVFPGYFGFDDAAILYLRRPVNGQVQEG